MTQTLTAEAELAARELAMIMDPLSWPHWPILPLKRRDRILAAPDSLGFLVDYGHPYTVYLAVVGNFAKFASAMAKADDWQAALNSLSKRTFTSRDEMLAVYMID